MLNRKSKTKGPAFDVRTRLTRAAGKDGRYSCGAVRVLPSVNQNEVVLQVTDGQQAACLLGPGQLAGSRLVPAQVLPTRQLPKPAVIRLIDGHWQSAEGRIASDDCTGEKTFPPVADVLPAVGKSPFCQVSSPARQRSKEASTHVVLGIDVGLLRKTADAFGARKLTLFIPVPVGSPNERLADRYVNKPVAVCPATKDTGSQGVVVVMPFAPENANGYYSRVPDVVIASEKRAVQRSAQRQSKRASAAG